MKLEAVVLQLAEAEERAAAAAAASAAAMEEQHKGFQRAKYEAGEKLAAEKAKRREAEKAPRAAD